MELTPPLKEKPTSSTTSKKAWLVKVIIVLVILAAIILGVLIGLLAVKLHSQHSTDVCTSPGCIATGQRLAASLNTSVDPCEDFAAYACGGWAGSHPIPYDKAILSSFTILSDQTLKMLKTVIEEEGKKKYSSSEAKSVRLVLDLYRECMNSTARDARARTPLLNLLKEVLGSAKWPVVEEEILTQENLTSNVQKDGALLKTLANLVQLRVSPLILFRASKDALGMKESDKKIVTFYAPYFGLSRKEFENVNGSYQVEVDLYKQQTKEFTSLLSPLSETIKPIQNYSSNKTKQLLSARFEELFALEKSLSLATLPESELRNPTAHYHKMTLAEFGLQTENYLNYTTLLNGIAELYKLPYRFNSTDEVVVRDIGYYRELSRILFKTPPVTLYNYLAHKLALKWAPYTDQFEQSFSFKFQSQQTGIKTEPQAWMRCLKVVNGWAVARLFVERFVQNSETKNQVSKMVANLRAAFTEVLRRDVDWLDSTTRNKALEKAAKTRLDVAYPDWLMNNTALDLIKYGLSKEDYIKVQSGHYFESQLEMARQTSGIHLQELHQPLKVDKEYGFSLSPSTVNAQVVQGENLLTIPAAILQPPFFDPSLPFYLNYGAIGMVIGHEITHLFDDRGSQFDAEGNLVNWWSEETKARFKERTKCFVDQYESIIDRQTGIRLNGKRSLGENLSDNSGVRTSFLTMEARLKKENKTQPQLPQMEHFSPHQLFFLSFAQMWCEQQRFKQKKISLEHWNHMPGEYRINVPLSNLKQFSTAFSCPVGSRMNPQKKCRLW